MALLTENTRAVLQGCLDTTFGDDVVLKLHSRRPGYDCSEHLLYGTGLPQPHKFSSGEQVEFKIPAYPEPRPWWKRLFTRSQKRVKIVAISAWRDGNPIDVVGLGLNTISLGGVLLVDVPKPTIS
ncbi:hypothetical protein [Nocardia aurea]|uniref:hypothetical protein n=1 Tax=Nocardia aurea TaxID=2144174 RepID=UPI0033BA65D9